jgi:hypothetical protein
MKEGVNMEKRDNYFITFGCGMGENSIIVSAPSIEVALEYAEESAKEEAYCYEGFHGILSLEDFCNEENLDYFTLSEEEKQKVNEDYDDYILGILNYSAVLFDINNENHKMVWDECEHEAWLV